MKTSRLNYNIIRLDAIDKNDYYIKCKQSRRGGDVANVSTNAPHTLPMALLTSISRSRKSNTMHLFISPAFSCLNLSTSRNTRWLHTAYPSLLAFAAAWYRWRDILVQYALALLPKVSAINATAADCCFSSFLRSLKRQPPPPSWTSRTAPPSPPAAAAISAFRRAVIG